MDQREHFQKAKDKLESIIRSEKERHKDAIKIENEFHTHRIAELEQIIIQLDARFPKFLKNESENL